MRTQLDPSALYWASFNRFELRLPGEAVADLSGPGPAKSTADYWQHRVANEWPDRATPDAIREELSEYGAWDEEELSDDAANWRRILWIAAGNISEEEDPDCSDPVA